MSKDEKLAVRASPFAAAVKTAAKSLKDLRIAEVIQLDMQIEEGQVLLYRAKVKVSFKYHTED